MARIQTKLNKETSKPEAGEGPEYMRRVDRSRDNDIQVLKHFKVVVISKSSIQPWLLRLYLLGYRHPFLPFSKVNTGSNIILAAAVLWAFIFTSHFYMVGMPLYVFTSFINSFSINRVPLLWPLHVFTSFISSFSIN